MDLTISASASSQPSMNITSYDLDEGDIKLLKSQTGIQDGSALRDHVFEVEAQAYAVKAYPCIRMFWFAKGQIAEHQAYQQALALGRARKDAIFLDMGCCMGGDIRRAISDGFPKENFIGVDIVPEFWDLGHKLFKSSQDTFPVPFLVGDIFDADFLSPNLSSALDNPSPPQAAPPPLSMHSSLTPLCHSISIIHINLVFHMFTEEKQRTLAQRLAMLLSPTPGSMIFGTHGGLDDTEENRNGGNRFSAIGIWQFAHSPTSWRNLWAGKDGIFKPSEVVVKASAIMTPSKSLMPGAEEESPVCRLHWSITRV